MKKILVIQQKMIGDVLVSSILCENLRLSFPDAQIDYLIYESTLPVVEGSMYISNFILFTEKERKNKIALLKFACKIRKTKYDIVIDAYSKLESLLIVLFSGASKKISFNKKFRNLFYTDLITRHSNYSSNLGLIIEQRLALLEPLRVEKKVIFPSITVSASEKTFASALFEENAIDTHKKTIMISVLGSDTTKTYPLPYMASIIDCLAANFEVNLLFNYSPNQQEEAKKVYDLCTTSTQQKIYFKVIGNSIREFIAIMNQCDLIIGNDGGATNMAKALQKPSFILFCPWIDKKGWALLEDGTNHVSLHLEEFLPEVFLNKSAKEVKKNYSFYYEKFEPKLVIPSLSSFLKNHIDNPN